MKILVTGGAGYIGSHAVLALLEKDFDVVVFDSLENGHKESLDRIETYTKKKVDFVKGDLRNADDVEKLLKIHHDIDAVLHFAAFIEVGESVKDPGKYYRNIVCGSLNLINALINHNINKIVFSSTAAVYGMPKRIPISEEDEKSPINPYGTAKLTVERMLDDFHKSHGLNSIRLRYFNACGASRTVNIGEDHHPESHVIPLLMQCALGTREKFYIFGNGFDTSDGTQIRDYVHVEDLVDAHIKALELMNVNSICDFINLGTSKGYSVQEVINIAKEVSGVDFTVELGEYREGDPVRLLADNSKAKKLLDWEPRIGLREIVESAWNWHLKNPNGYKS